MQDFWTINSSTSLVVAVTRRWNNWRHGHIRALSGTSFHRLLMYKDFTWSYYNTFNHRNVGLPHRKERGIDNTLKKPPKAWFDCYQNLPHPIPCRFWWLSSQFCNLVIVSSNYTIIHVFFVIHQWYNFDFCWGRVETNNNSDSARSPKNHRHSIGGAMFAAAKFKWRFGLRQFGSDEDLGGGGWCCGGAISLGGRFFRYKKKQHI